MTGSSTEFEGLSVRQVLVDPARHFQRPVAAHVIGIALN